MPESKREVALKLLTACAWSACSLNRLRRCWAKFVPIASGTSVPRNVTGFDTPPRAYESAALCLYRF